MINFNLFKNVVRKRYILSPKILPDVLEKQASCVVYRVRHDTLFAQANPLLLCCLILNGFFTCFSLIQGS